MLVWLSAGQSQPHLVFGKAIPTTRPPLLIGVKLFSLLWAVLIDVIFFRNSLDGGKSFEVIENVQAELATMKLDDDDWEDLFERLASK